MANNEHKILDLLPYLIFEVNEEGVIQYSSPGFAKYLSTIPEAITKLRGGNAMHCTHLTDSEQGCGFGDFCKNECGFRKLLNQTLEIKEMVEDEITFTSEFAPDITLYFRVRMIPSPEKTESGKESVIVCIEDITSQKQLAQAKEEQKRLEGALILGVTASHEINNPLTVIHANLEILKEQGVDPEIISESMESTIRISKVIKKLTSLVQLEEQEYCRGINYLDLEESIKKK